MIWSDEEHVDVSNKHHVLEKKSRISRMPMKSLIPSYDLSD